jgi:hypothetical protein
MGYFETMDIPILHGRGLLESDGKVRAAGRGGERARWQTALLAERRRGRQAISTWERQAAELVEIVGIARTAKYRWIAERRSDFVYLPFRQHPQFQADAGRRIERPDGNAIAPALREVVRGSIPTCPYSTCAPCGTFYAQRAVKVPNMVVKTTWRHGSDGLLLAIVGLYGLVAYSVSRRTREIGIRMALGADRRKVVRMVLRQGLRLGAAGVAAGLVVSYFACRAVTSAIISLFTFDRVDPSDSQRHRAAAARDYRAGNVGAGAAGFADRSTASAAGRVRPEVSTRRMRDSGSTVAGTASQNRTQARDA